MNINALSSSAPLSTPNNRKFNGGSEFTSDFGINTYETLFRGYDPQLGRFNQIDPLADFVSGINPYQYAFDNPILYNDIFGLVPGCSRSDFDTGSKAGRRAFRICKKNKRNARPGTSSRAKKRRLLRIAALKTITGGGIDHIAARKPADPNKKTIAEKYSVDTVFPKVVPDEPEPDSDPIISTPSEPEPTFNSFVPQGIKPGTEFSFNRLVKFKPKSDIISEDDQTKETINYIIGILNAYPNARLIVLGNTGRTKGIPGNSPEALSQEATLNGQKTTAGVLTKSRADAVIEALRSKEVTNRMYGYSGNVYLNKTTKGKRGLNTSFIIKF